MTKRQPSIFSSFDDVWNNLVTISLYDSAKKCQALLLVQLPFLINTFSVFFIARQC